MPVRPIRLPLPRARRPSSTGTGLDSDRSARMRLEVASEVDAVAVGRAARPRRRRCHPPGPAPSPTPASVETLTRSPSARARRSRSAGDKTATDRRPVATRYGSPSIDRASSISIRQVDSVIAVVAASAALDGDLCHGGEGRPITVPGTELARFCLYLVGGTEAERPVQLLGDPGEYADVGQRRRRRAPCRTARPDPPS